MKGFVLDLIQQSVCPANTVKIRYMKVLSYGAPFGLWEALVEYKGLSRRALKQGNPGAAPGVLRDVPSESGPPGVPEGRDLCPYENTPSSSGPNVGSFATPPATGGSEKGAPAFPPFEKRIDCCDCKTSLG